MLPKSACLSEITRHEGALLEARLGVRKKGKTGVDDTSPEARRGAVERELRPLFDEGLSLPTVLAAYETRPDREPSLTISALREAAVWERLSVGLHATFLLWLRHIRSPGTAKSMLVWPGGNRRSHVRTSRRSRSTAIPAHARSSRSGGR